MKICSKCKIEKGDEEYSFRIKNVKRLNVCKECHKDYTKNHYKNNVNGYKDRVKKYKQDIRQKVLDKFDNKCEECGCSEKTILEINHINGKGYFERNNEKMHTYKIYKEALNTEGKYNLLCRVCNAKHYVESILGIKGFTVKFSADDAMERKHPISVE